MPKLSKNHRNDIDTMPLLDDLSSELSSYISPSNKKRKSPNRNYRKGARKGDKESLPLLANELSSYVSIDKKRDILGNDYHNEIKSLQQLDNAPPHNILSEGVCEKLSVKDFSELVKPKESPEPGFMRRALSRMPKPPGFIVKAFPWVTSKAAIKTINIAIPAVAFAGIGALSGGVVPAVAIGIAVGTITFNSIRDTRSLRALKELEQEHNLLQEYQLSKNIEKSANKLVRDKTGVDLVESDDSSLQKTKSKRNFKSKYENNLTSRSLAKTIRDNAFEALGNIATATVVATSGLANAAMNAMSIGVTAGVFGIVDVALTTINRRKMNIIKNGMVKNIDILREGVSDYNSIAELTMLTREQKIKTEALNQLASVDLVGFDKEALEAGLNLQKVVAGQKFEVPLKPTFWQKTKQYFKDFNSANWPNDYYTGSRFADKLDADSKELVERYDVMSRGIQHMSKAHNKAQSIEGHDLNIVQDVIRGRKRIQHEVGHSFI